MKIIFDKISINNFLSIGNAEINLNGQNYTNVVGVNRCLDDNAMSNGSGKSSIFDAILWALTGETVRGCKDVGNLFTEEGALVELYFYVNSDYYHILRTRNHSQYKTTLKIWVNDKDMSGKGIKDGDKLLSSYLPDLTPELVSSVIILGQGLPQRFSSNTPSGRKEILEKLSKSDFMIEDLKTRVAMRKTSLNSKKRELEDKSLVLSTEIRGFKNEILKSQSILSTLETSEQYTEKIKELTEKNNLLENQVSELNSYIEEKKDSLSKTQNTFNEFNTLYTNTLDSLMNANKESIDLLNNEVIKLKSEIQSLHSEIVKLDNISDVCPTCGQKLVGVEKPDTTELKTKEIELKKTLSEKNSELDKLNTEKNSALLSFKSKSSDAKTKITLEITSLTSDINISENNKKSLNNQINSNSKEISEYEGKISNLEESVKFHNNNIEEATQKINSNEEQIKSINDSISDVTDRMAIVNKFDTYLKRDFRGYLLTSVIDFMNVSIKKYSNIVFNNTNTEIRIEGNNINIYSQGKQYEMMSGGEKQKIDLLIQFSLRDMLSSVIQFSSNIIVLDEVMDFLDSTGCNTVINLIQEACQDVSSIFIVSHHTDLGLPCDNTLTVVKDNTGVAFVEKT